MHSIQIAIGIYYQHVNRMFFLFKPELIRIMQYFMENIHGHDLLCLNSIIFAVAECLHSFRPDVVYFTSICTK